MLDLSAVQQLRQSLAHPNVVAFLRMIRQGETDQSERAYYTLFGGEQAASLADHPRRSVTRGGLTSTAAGAYQFLSRTWDECEQALDLPDFSAGSQDLAAVYLISRRGALGNVLTGRVEAAIARCNREWASLPGSPYGQPTVTLERALATYRQWGGTVLDSAPGHATFADDAPAAASPSAPAAAPAAQPIPDAAAAPPAQPEEPAMPLPLLPFLTAAVDAVGSVVPALIRTFGGGSQMTERNAKAAELVVQAAKAATGATNEQELIEKIAGDPAAAQQVRDAVQAIWHDVVEAGGGGIAGARAADLAAIGELKGEPWWATVRSPSFVVGCLLLPLVYLIVLSLIGSIGTAQWSPDARAGIAGMITGSIVGGLVGYYYGQTTTRNRTPAAPGGAA